MCPYSLSVPGGVQGQVLGLGRALRASGHEVAVLAPVDGEADPAWDTVVALGRSVPVPANGSVARLAIGPQTAARTVRALRQLTPEVLHLHEPLAPGPTWVAMARHEPKVGTFHRAGAVSGRALLAPLARVAAGRLAVRTAVSQQARATAMALLGGDAEDYRIIGNGIELERFGRIEPWPTDGPTVLFVGRHEPRKGLAVLLEAFARLDPQVAARLWVAGEGPQTAELRRRFGAVAGVQWIGRIADEELHRRLLGAQVLCAPSLGGESFGVVLLEAMAARAVVVASDIAGYGAVVGRHGLLVAPGDVTAWTGALRAVLADVDRGTGLASAASLEAAARHAGQWPMATVAERYLESYEEAVRIATRGTLH